MSNFRTPVRFVISDMDGVLYRGKELIPGAASFVSRLQTRGIPFLFLTNASEPTAADLSEKLASLGIPDLPPERFFTSGMASASFVASQQPGATVYVVGGDGLRHELTLAGLTVVDATILKRNNHPDYVVVGKTVDFDFRMMKEALTALGRGARFVGTNPDLVDPVEDGLEPACGAILAGIERASGKRPYIVGKPNALMMQLALRRLHAHPEDTLMVGDRMDTDIVAGLEAGMSTCLVLSGVSTRDQVSDFPYRPDLVVENAGEIVV